MKALISIIILLQFTNDTYARHIVPKEYTLHNNKNVINKFWVGPGGECLEITKDSAFFSNAISWDLKFVLYFNDNMLELISENAHDKKIFRVDQLNEDTLVLTAVNDNAFDLIKTLDPVIFVNREILYDPLFSFQKIIYERSGAGLARSDYLNVRFEIDSSGSMLLSCVGKLNGTYKGILSHAQMGQLTALINRSAIERFDIPWSRAKDVPSYHFRFYYNNKMKEAFGSGVPYLAKDLLHFLDSLINETHLEKISDKFGNAPIKH